MQTVWSLYSYSSAQTTKDEAMNMLEAVDMHVKKYEINGDDSLVYVEVSNSGKKSIESLSLTILHYRADGTDYFGSYKLEGPIGPNEKLDYKVKVIGEKFFPKNSITFGYSDVLFMEK
jgi:hypothetical protein